jgi:hypothetical protein
MCRSVDETLVFATFDFLISPPSSAQTASRPRVRDGAIAPDAAVFAVRKKIMHWTALPAR